MLQETTPIIFWFRSNSVFFSWGVTNSMFSIFLRLLAAAILSGSRVGNSQSVEGQRDGLAVVTVALVLVVTQGPREILDGIRKLLLLVAVSVSHFGISFLLPAGLGNSVGGSSLWGPGQKYLDDVIGFTFVTC